jgi:hypothetical protein
MLLALALSGCWDWGSFHGAAADLAPSGLLTEGGMPRDAGPKDGSAPGVVCTFGSSFGSCIFAP